MSVTNNGGASNNIIRPLIISGGTNKCDCRWNRPGTAKKTCKTSRMAPEQAGEEHEETAIGLEANVALVIKGIIKGIDKLLRGVGMEDAVRKGVSEMHTPSFTTHALVARLQTCTDSSPMHPNSQVMFHSYLLQDQRPCTALLNASLRGTGCRQRCLRTASGISGRWRYNCVNDSRRSMITPT